MPDSYSITISGVPFLFSDTLVRKRRTITYAFLIKFVPYTASSKATVSHLYSFLKSYLLVNFCLQISRVSSAHCQVEALQYTNTSSIY
jgi:hypothetical protein